MSSINTNAYFKTLLCEFNDPAQLEHFGHKTCNRMSHVQHSSPS